MSRIGLPTTMIIGLTMSAFLVACTKEDKKGGDIEDKLTSKYCNIPNAVNYNWGFPGIADNSVCYFATDYYSGTWKWIDSVRLADSTLTAVDTLYLSFHKQANDETYTRMNLTGWCGNEAIVMNVNKYFIGTSDTFFNSDGWQLLCNNTDSLKVDMYKDLIDTTIVKLSILQFKNNTMYYHNGTATKN